MSITSIARNFAGVENFVSVVSSDSTESCLASGYLTAQASNIAAANNSEAANPFQWMANDLILLSASDGISLCSINASFTTLSEYGGFGPYVNSVVLASAAPGTVRSITGKISDSVLMTSGNIVGVRGEADYVGASGGFIYGAQGKIIPTGTLSGSSWNAGVFGQLDISAATINAGQIAPIWGDYGATSGTLTDVTGCYGIAMTNTTHVICAGQIYLYGGATDLLKLNDNNGLVGATYFQNAGSGGSSWGNATVPPPTKVLQISVNGTSYWLGLQPSNS